MFLGDNCSGLLDWINKIKSNPWRTYNKYLRVNKLRSVNSFVLDTHWNILYIFQLCLKLTKAIFITINLSSATSPGMWDLNSPIRDPTCATCIWSSESKPLDCQGSPTTNILECECKCSYIYTHICITYIYHIYVFRYVFLHKKFQEFTINV